MKFYIKSLYRPKAGMAKILLVMKLIIVLLTTAILQVSASSYGQNVTLKRDNTELVKIFTELRKQTGYDFFYSDQMMEDAIPVTLHLKNVPIEKALELCFKDQPLSYTINNKIVTVKLREKSIFDRIIDRFQAIDIYGRVMDESGTPLVGASVKVKNKKQVTTTDSKGEFTLKGVDEKAILVISYVGYEDQEVSISNPPGNLQIYLKASVSGLEEIQVTINTGYQQIKPEQSTGSISVLNRKEYESRINTTDFLTGLQNKIPGLLINNDITFEGNNLFQIRGISTITGNKSPLIILDGYPTDLSLQMIDPNEIESVTVLKDAAAATIYGARSSNGVIIVERKKAKIGNTQVQFRSTAGFRPKEDYTRYRWADNASEIVTNYEKIKNMNAAANLWARHKTAQGGINNYSPGVLIMHHWRSSTGAISEEERDRQLAELASYNNAADYSDLFLRSSSDQTYNLDLSGGTDRVLYYVTANYTGRNATQVKNDDGIFRLSGRSTVKISNKLSVELNTDLQSINKTTVPLPDINKVMPYERFQDAAGNPAALYQLSKVTPIYNEYIMSLGLRDNLYYPLREMNEVSDKTRGSNNRVTTNFRYNTGNGLNFSVGGVFESARTDIRHLASENSAEVNQIVNYYTKPGTGGALIYNVPRGAFLKQTTASTQGFTLRTQANYDKEVAKDHMINVILGAEMRKTVNNSNLASYFGYNDQTLINQAVDFRAITNNFGPTYANINGPQAYNNLFKHTYLDDRYVSGYSNLVYSYKSKYSATGSIRIDQSNLFGNDPKYKYKPLWSVGAAWNINKEDFMQNLAWVRSLKLRAAYGFNGNVAKEALPEVIASDGLNTLNPSLSIPNLSLLAYANSGLRWEQTRNFNLGLDYELFKGIRGGIDFYQKQSTDVLAINQIDASKGGTSALINEASIRNRGIELNLQADWITRRRFNWNTGFVLANNTSKVLQVYNVNINDKSPSWQYVAGANSNYVKGYAVGTIFNYRYARLDETGYPMIYDKDGNAKRYHTNDAGIDDLSYAGSSIPVINFGISNRVDIGNFYAYAMVNYFGNFKTKVPIPDASMVRPLQGADNYWKQAGDEADPNMLPDVTSSMGAQYYFFLAGTDRYTVNGSYLTLGDLTAAYSFRGSAFLKRVKLSNLEIRAQASNVFTVGFNDYNYSVATGSYAKSYMTPTYTGSLLVNF
ncbi:SusC/RagA family TonB-linked outer membrane protein [Pedobacter faecalis]|uniref:SusC/RagA family TonB-linked outer membrane protein n=1 Tax=Pedobacter faecalis TaxID=3041495 RepID=UPI002549EA3A|nr:SusC/RagA family TonB-linked outer membrane protein [Pedobacter sp. ELA7]